MNIKILICHHKPYHKIPDSEILVPIHVGRAISSKKERNLLKGFIGDDTANSISNRNKNFCELTAIYWAWKNQVLLGNPEYIGLFHYRRWLNFKYSNSEYDFANCNNLSSDEMEKYGWGDDAMKSEIGKYDIILPQQMTFYKGEKPITIYDYYCIIHPKKDIDLMLEIIEQKFPEYHDAASLLKEKTSGHFFNISIMKKGIFDEYCEFIFGVLFELEKKINIEKYDDSYQKRVFGFLGERLMEVFLLKKEMTDPLIKKCEKQTVIIENDFDKKLNQKRQRRKQILRRIRKAIRAFLLPSFTSSKN